MEDRSVRSKETKGAVTGGQPWIKISYCTVAIAVAFAIAFAVAFAVIVAVIIAVTVNDCAAVAAVAVISRECTFLLVILTANMYSGGP